MRKHRGPYWFQRGPKGVKQGQHTPTRPSILSVARASVCKGRSGAINRYDGNWKPQLGGLVCHDGRGPGPRYLVLAFLEGYQLIHLQQIIPSITSTGKQQLSYRYWCVGNGANFNLMWGGRPLPHHGLLVAIGYLS